MGIFRRTPKVSEIRLHGVQQSTPWRLGRDRMDNPKMVDGRVDDLALMVRKGYLPADLPRSPFANSVRLTLEADTSAGVQCFTWDSLGPCETTLSHLADMIARPGVVVIDPQGEILPDDPMAAFLARNVFAVWADEAPHRTILCGVHHSLQKDCDGNALLVGPAGSGKSALAIQWAIRHMAVNPQARCHVLGYGNGDGMVFGGMLKALGRGTWHDIRPRHDHSPFAIATAALHALRGAEACDVLLINDIDVLQDEVGRVIEAAEICGVRVIATMQMVKRLPSVKPWFNTIAFLPNHGLDGETRLQFLDAMITAEGSEIVNGVSPVARTYHRPAVVAARDGLWLLETALPRGAPMLPLLAWDYRHGHAALAMAGEGGADPMEWLGRFTSALGGEKKAAEEA